MVLEEATVCRRTLEGADRRADWLRLMGGWVAWVLSRLVVVEVLMITVIGGWSHNGERLNVGSLNWGMLGTEILS